MSNHRKVLTSEGDKDSEGERELTGEELDYVNVHEQEDEDDKYLRGGELEEDSENEEHDLKKCTQKKAT